MNIHINPSFYIGLCISLLILPVQWVCAWLVAALVHELGHLLALKLCAVPVARISIGFAGAVIDTAYIPPGTEILSALAGPFAGCSCLLLSSIAPEIAICGFAQTAYNLLPFPSYDGGRVLRGILCLVFSDAGEGIYRWLLRIFAACMAAVGCYLAFMAGLGVVPMILCLIPVVKSGIVKRPCKRSKQIVQ